MKFSFTYCSSIEIAADNINLPHEDYPTRVHETERAIFLLASVYEVEGKASVNEDMVKAIHRLIFPDLLNAGEWRRTPVVIGSTFDRGVNAIDIPFLMSRIEVNRFDTIEEVKQWYQAFENIHPFLDGNGRVGGVVLAAATQYLGELLAPGQ